MNRLALIGSALLCLACAVIILVYRASPGAPRQNEFTVTNETEALQVVSAQLENKFLVVTLKNASTQPIISYHIDVRASAGLTPDLMGDPLAPGAQLTINLPLVGLPRDEKGYRFNIAMALFANGAGEGDWDKTQTQREKFEGASLALQQISPQLQTVQPSALTRLGSEIGGMEPPSTLSKHQQEGYAHILSQAHLKLTLAERATAAGKNEVIAARELQDSMHNQTAKLRAFTERRKEQ